jgi:hypothetical protein
MMVMMMMMMMINQPKKRVDSGSYDALMVPEQLRYHAE